MSQISAREDSESPLARQHWLSENIPVEAWGDVLAGVDGMSDSLVTHLKVVGVDHQNGIFRGETDVVEKIGGRPPSGSRAAYGPVSGITLHRVTDGHVDDGTFLHIDPVPGGR